MSKKICIGIVLFYLILQISVCTAAVPRIEPYVNDFAHLLTQDEINALNQYCDDLEKNTTYEVAIVTVQNTGGEDRIQFANEIGDQNGVGKKGKDNGIVVLWSVQDGGAIATGRYSESIFNDAKVTRIGKAARPYFDKGEYANGFTYILNQIAWELQAAQSANSTVTSTPSKPVDTGHVVLFVMIIIVGIWIFSKLFDFDFGSALAGVAIGSILSRGSSSSSSSGGKSFGGGSFGGGGGKF